MIQLTLFASVLYIRIGLFADPDPGSQNNTDPYKCIFERQKTPGLFVNSGQFQCSWIQIRIPDPDPGSRTAKLMLTHADPDPQLCFADRRRLETLESY